MTLSTTINTGERDWKVSPEKPNRQYEMSNSNLFVSRSFSRSSCLNGTERLDNFKSPGLFCPQKRISSNHFQQPKVNKRQRWMCLLASVPFMVLHNIRPERIWNIRISVRRAATAAAAAFTNTSLRIPWWVTFVPLRRSKCSERLSLERPLLVEFLRSDESVPLGRSCLQVKLSDQVLVCLLELEESPGVGGPISMMAEAIRMKLKCTRSVGLADITEGQLACSCPSSSLRLREPQDLAGSSVDLFGHRRTLRPFNMYLTCTS